MIGRLKSWWQRDAANPDDRADGTGRPVRVLLVCMGNICRSPTAQGVLQVKLQQAGLQGRVVVASAGTQGTHAGEAPDPRAVRQAAQRGYDIAGQRARQVTADDYARYDWMLAMDQANLRSLLKRKPDGSAVRIELMLAQSATPATTATTAPAGLDVPDPYYGSTVGFDHVLDLLEAACDGFVIRLQTALETADQARQFTHATNRAGSRKLD